MKNKFKKISKKKKKESQTSVSIWKKPDREGMTLVLIYVTVKRRRSQMQRSPGWE